MTFQMIVRALIITSATNGCTFARQQYTSQAKITLDQRS